MYTVFAINPENEQMGDALLVEDGDLNTAIETLREYWEDYQEQAMLHCPEAIGDFGVHVEAHQDSVRDSRGWKPLPWRPGQPVIDTTISG
jgi:hypothetical protein